MEHRVSFRLELSRAAFLAHYQGVAAQVSVRADDGRRVQFPAVWLRRFVTETGVSGRFELRFGADHRLIELRRTGD
jgi:hypothetical protein